MGRSKPFGVAEIRDRLVTTAAIPPPGLAMSGTAKSRSPQHEVLCLRYGLISLPENERDGANAQFVGEPTCVAKTLDAVNRMFASEA